MNSDILNLNNQLYSNHHNLLLGIVNDLNQLMNYINDNLAIKRIGDVIVKLNSIINENKIYFENIRNDISKMYAKMNKNFEDLKINKDKNQELVNHNGRFYGQVINGLPEGKGVMTYNDGDKYEGEWKNAKFEGRGIYTWNNGDRYIGDFKNGLKDGKGIMYWKDGDRYEGDFRNDKREGKGIFYFNNEFSFNGDRYEGDWRNGKKEGKGIYYYHNGDREMGDYSNENKIGKHAILTSNGEVKAQNY